MVLTFLFPEGQLTVGLFAWFFELPFYRTYYAILDTDTGMYKGTSETQIFRHTSIVEVIINFQRTEAAY